VTTPYSQIARRLALVCMIAPALLSINGCGPAPRPAATATQDGRIDLPDPRPDPTRDEAAELIKVCGTPTSDTWKSVEAGTQRILSYHRYGVDVFFLQNGSDSPRWASTAVFVGEDTINRKTLSRKMPCTKKMSLHSVDVLDPYMLNH
jgi:hypothetical protein